MTVCSRPSCQAYYCNDFYCFKMSRHTPETQCMKVISFHCEQTEASLRGNRTSVWPLQADDLSQAESGCRTESEARGLKGGS